MTADEDSEETAAQVPLVSSAWRFLKPFYESRNLVECWQQVDPVLHLCWAQWWLHANRAAVQADGYDLDGVAELLIAEPGEHPLWPHFERVVLRDFSAAFPLDPTTWGIGTAPRVLAPDVELLYVHRQTPDSGYWSPGASAQVVPLVMHFRERCWRVLNLGSERIPEPGWPPAL